jgi:hypothetical protein
MSDLCKKMWTYVHTHAQTHKYVHTGCCRRNIPCIGRTLLRSNYIDITKKYQYPKLNDYGDNGKVRYKE